MKKQSERKEIKYYGMHACVTLWKMRPHDVIRVYLDESNVKELRPLLKWCADNKKAYHIIPPHELDKVSDSVHHEGVCILAKEMPSVDSVQFFRLLPKSKKVCLLYLDGVQNPHNIGAIMRSCAHFGVGFILGSKDKLPLLSPSACRMAKGAAEIVKLVPLEKPVEILNRLHGMGFELIATSSHKGTSLYTFNFPSLSILAMGSEGDGLSLPIFKLAKHPIVIPGTGLVESLNVSVATSVCLSEYSRQHQ